MTIANLQRAMAQVTEESEAYTRSKDRQHLEDMQRIQELEGLNEEIKGRIRGVAQIETANQEMQAMVAALKEEIERGQHEISRLKGKEEEYLHKIKKDSEALEFMVDRRIINKFLVNYANPSSSFEVKLQMLDTMSKILGFSHEEKQTLGLIKAAGNDATNSAATANAS